MCCAPGCGSGAPGPRPRGPRSRPRSGPIPRPHDGRASVPTPSDPDSPGTRAGLLARLVTWMRIVVEHRNLVNPARVVEGTSASVPPCLPSETLIEELGGLNQDAQVPVV